MTQPIAALTEYQDWLHSIKQRVQSARLRAALAANSELIALYYELGARIVEQESVAQRCSSFIDTFCKDLRQSFPDIGGFSPKSLRYCRAFFRFYCDPAIWLQAVANKDNIEVEFALRDMTKPMGVNEYTVTETLPDNLEGSMPTVEKIEQNLQQLREDVAE